MNTIPVENHPLHPFLPTNAKILLLGSFPPPLKRWCIDFYYPNFNNDMWRILGVLFYQNKSHFIDLQKKTFKQKDIIRFAKETGIAIYDTATKVKRLKDNASDKYLEVVEPTDIKKLLDQLPNCQAIITTGEKATGILQEQLNIEKAPKIKEFVSFTYKNKEYRLYRMPSSSRAYPLKLEKKANAYRFVFQQYFQLNQQS